ncbi:MAG TPA: HAMP domain-containing sensor histidine kinase [Actinomycetota bacterium]|nr:HAMP domain-containing sensor histidine kinase [Actinomycetota bacterium]
MSLRGRLLLATGILVVLGLLVADGATYGLLRGSLISRVDAQLVSYSRDPRGLGQRGGFNNGPDHGLPQQYVEFIDGSGNKLISQPILGADYPPRVPANLLGSQTTGSGYRIVTTKAIGSPGRYRVIIFPAQLGGPGFTQTAGTGIIAISLAEVAATLHKLLLVELLVTLSVIAAAGGAAWWLIRKGLQPLTEIEGAAADIAAGDLSRRIEMTDENTEVGRLGNALNVMLEKIEQAFAERRASEARLRRFVADASHELRTPLTSIRGYAELFRRGARSRPDDLEKSMQRIEDESARMGVLVDELLLLARLDQGPKLDREPIDLARVAADAVHDARVVQPDRPIDISADEPVVVQGDDTRLRQVAANLMSNALEHTPRGTPVHVRVSRDGEQAVLEVADEGPGLDEEHAAKVFDRFFRVDPSRARDNGGAGLGLAIVAAIAGVHGGSVSVDTSPGNGARFTVRLPVSAPTADAEPEPESVEQPAEATEQA